MSRLLGLILLAATAVTGCSDSDSGRSDDPWEQNWILDHLETPEGVANGSKTPKGVSVQFEPWFGGSDGCDLFIGAYNYDDPTLTFPTVEYTYAEANPRPATCPEDSLMVVEAMRDALTDGVAVTTMTADTMVWQSESGEITFEFYPGVEG